MGVDSDTSEDQWYKKSPELYQMEIDAMKTVCPEAFHGFLDTGQMYWIVPYFPSQTDSKKSGRYSSYMTPVFHIMVIQYGVTQ